LAHALPKAHWIDPLSECTYQGHPRDLTLLEKELPPLATGTWVVIDEVQGLPELLNEVHRQIEKKN
jgi:hypothetical protein